VPGDAQGASSTALALIRPHRNSACDKDPNRGAIVPGNTEIELKFLVPDEAREAIAAELARGSPPAARTALAAMYLDTEDRQLARSGIAWRLRREGERWVQTLKARTHNAMERFEHEVPRPDATHDAAQHAGTRAGDALIELLRAARKDHLEVGTRFSTEVERTAQRVSTNGTVVEIAFDEGNLLATASRLRICELEFELVSGSVTAMLDLAEQWRERFGLILDPRSKAERGDRLAEGLLYPPLRKASRPHYPRDASVSEAFGAVLDECLAQIGRNAIGLVEGDPSLRVEHVHQLRVGIRRLRSALRSFEGWVPSPPEGLIDDLRELFATLGMSRDSDVLDSGVATALAKAGAPSLSVPAAATGPDPAAAARAPATQRCLLGWIAWRALLAAEAVEPVEPVEPALVEHARSDADTPEKACNLRREAAKRLAKWHRRIVADSKIFDELDDERLHSLRKRIKRQRYAVEFFAPVLRPRTLERYLARLTPIQDRMGELNDLVVARARYEALVASEPAAWFARGWISARLTEVRALAKGELRRLAKAEPPPR
jgi:triphosphatase